MELLTTAEAADYLRLKERKLYELVAEGGIPCTKVTGKWLFPKPELDHWLLASLIRPAGLGPAAPPPIVGGSHDPLLEWALRESRCGLASLAEGSERGLERFAAHEVLAAAIHLHGLDEAADANRAAVAAMADCVLIGFCRREQGLLAMPGNPLGLGSLADVAARGARLAMRPKGAGAQLLLLAFLHRAGLDLAALTSGPLCPTGPDLAQAIRAGHADCGIATRSVANLSGLDFVPLAWESFDLAIRPPDFFRPAMQALMMFIRTPEFIARAAEMGGYDIGAAGQVRWAG